MMLQCKCVFPTTGEQEWLTIPGDEPGTAFRLFVESSQDGYVRLQQMAYTEGLGWYVQKSLVVCRDVLQILVPQLRKALCVMPPRSAAKEVDSIPFLRIAPGGSDEPVERTG
jgi:hypothetical protein